MEYFLSREEQEIYEKFAAAYDLVEYFDTDVDEEPVRIPRKMRECRFCGKGFGDTSFKNDPHRFSNLLGNQYLIWDEECDDCNAKFSKYEKAMGEWFGLERVMADIRPGKKKFTFSSIDGNVTSRRLGQMILLEQRNPGGFTGNIAEGKVEVDVTPLPYVPAYVYNGLLKNALSAIAKTELQKYRAMLAVLMSEKAGRVWSGFRVVELVETNLAFDCPFICLYRRKLGINGCPAYTVCLYVRNKLFQIPLMNDEEGFRVDIEPTPILPFHFVAKSAVFNEPFKLNRRLVLLEGWGKVTPEKQTLKMVIDPEDLKKLVSVQMPPGFLEKIKKMNG